MNRIDRISAILIQLQSKKYVTAAEIGSRFSVSKRTIYRDLKTLEEAGVPIGAETGRGYFLVEGFHLPPVMFTADEANALLMAGKVVEKFTDRSVNMQFDSALYKIKSVLPEIGKELLSKLQPNIQVFFSASRENAQGFLSEIQMAIARQRTVTLEYYSQYKDEATKNRNVEPIGICFYSMHWHLIAYCRLRSGYRDFRIDRIRDLRINNEDFVPRKRLSLQEYFAGLMNETDLIQVTLRTEPATWAMLQNIRYYYGFVSEETVDGMTEMDFMVSDLNYFGRWILTFADGLEVVRPESLKIYLSELLQKMRAKHGE